MFEIAGGIILGLLGFVFIIIAIQEYDGRNR